MHYINLLLDIDIDIERRVFAVALAVKFLTTLVVTHIFVRFTGDVILIVNDNSYCERVINTLNKLPDGVNVSCVKAL